MARKDEKPLGNEIPEGYMSIEALKEKLGISDGVLSALKVHNDWADGLMMTEKDFKTAYDGWLKSPVKGRR